MSERRAPSDAYCTECDRPLIWRGECVLCDSEEDEWNDSPY
jgi:hypothetical protein